MVVETWVEAFAGDPFFRWIAPEDETWQRFATAWFSMIGGLCIERGHTYLSDDAAVAWAPPEPVLVGPDDMQKARGVFVEHAGEERTTQAFGVIAEARRHTLDEPHWTLQLIGVRAGGRGSGVGAAVAQAGLRTVDGDGLPCALNSTNLRNVPFYERLGFRVVAEIQVPGGTAAMRPMVRAPA